MAVKAYVLIEVDVGKAAEVVRAAQKLDYNTYRDEILRTGSKTSGAQQAYI